MQTSQLIGPDRWLREAQAQYDRAIRRGDTAAIKAAEAVLREVAEAIATVERVRRES